MVDSNKPLKVLIEMPVWKISPAMLREAKNTEIKVFIVFLYICNVSDEFFLQCVN